MLGLTINSLIIESIIKTILSSKRSNCCWVASLHALENNSWDVLANKTSWSSYLSLGLYSEKLTDFLDSEELGIKELFVNEVKEKDIPLEYPEMTLFLIIELVSSTVFTSIVESHPLPIEEFKPHLYKTIRLLINE